MRSFKDGFYRDWWLVVLKWDHFIDFLAFHRWASHTRLWTRGYTKLTCTMRLVQWAGWVFYKWGGKYLCYDVNELYVEVGIFLV